MAKAVTTLPSEKWRIVARVAGGDEREIIWHPDTSELEVPGVTDTALGNALVQVESGTAPPTVEDVAKKIKELKEAADAALEGGFQSDPKGTGAVWFDSSLEDQVNLIGNILAGGNTVHSNRPTQGGAKDYVAYTNAELLQVLQDGRDVKLANRQNLATKVAAAEAATTLAELNAITL